MNAQNKKIEEVIELNYDGYNINSKDEFVSVNTTRNILSNERINASNIDELKDLIKRFRNVRTKAATNTNANLRFEIDLAVSDWDKSSSKNNGEKCGMTELENWQKDLYSLLGQKEESKKIVFKDQKSHWEIVVVVIDASTRLTYEYMKLFSEFKKKYNNINSECVVISEKSYIKDDEDIILEYTNAN